MTAPRQDSSSPQGRTVPFARFFAILGYASFSFVALAAVSEVLCFFGMSIYRSRYILWLKAPSTEYRAAFGHRRGTRGSSGWFPEAEIDLMSSSPVYDGKAWADDFFREERSRYERQTFPYEPFTVWGPPAWHGKYVNDDDTDFGLVRRTVKLPCEAGENRSRAVVWVFGGSTVWGWGAPDNMTLPSLLAQKLQGALADCVEVTNLGAPNYVTSQEVVRLCRWLKSGRRPDIVIFYDGMNDAFVGGYLPGLPLAHADYESVRARFESNTTSLLGSFYTVRVLSRLFGPARVGAHGKLTDQEAASRAKATLNNYIDNLTEVQALSKAFGFKAYWFWQPSLFCGNKPLTPFEKATSDYFPVLFQPANTQAGIGFVQALQAAYREAERQAAEEGKFVYLGGIFDKTKEPIYADLWSHLGPEGNEMVADAIARYLVPQTRSAAGGSRELSRR